LAKDNVVAIEGDGRKIEGLTKVPGGNVTEDLPIARVLGAIGSVHCERRFER
jgi:hypothetical protein